MFCDFTNMLIIFFFIKNSLENRLVIVKRGGGVGKGVDWEFGICKYKLYYI